MREPGGFGAASAPVFVAWMVALLALAVAAASGVVEAFAAAVGLDRLDALALEEIGELRNRAAVAFAVSKTINAAISVAKEVTVSGGVGLAGVGVNPGQVLDPVDDLIEQFAVAMLLVAMAAQLLDIALPVGAAWGLGPVLAAGLLVLAVAAAFHLVGVRGGARAFARFGRILMALAMVLRIGVPAATLATEFVAESFLESRYTAAQEGIGALAQQATSVADEARKVQLEPQPDGVLERLFQGVTGGLSDFGKALALLRTNFEHAFEDVVTLIVVFLLETLLLPLLFLWLSWRFFRGLVAGSGWQRRSATDERDEGDR